MTTFTDLQSFVLKYRQNECPACFSERIEIGANSSFAACASCGCEFNWRAITWDQAMRRVDPTDISSQHPVRPFDYTFWNGSGVDRAHGWTDSRGDVCQLG